VTRGYSTTNLIYLNGMIRRYSLCTVFLALAAIGNLSARDHVLTIGGGYSPSGNQVSLERNVIFFEKLRAEKLGGDIRHDLYFADGNSPLPDLQFEPEGWEVPRANLYMAGLFGSERGITNQYRNNELKNTRDLSSPDAVERWFEEEGSKLESGDRLILYVTSHGGRSGNKDNKFNTKIWMWNRRTLEASRLAGWIAKLPEGVRVMTVMVQCYAGGFSHLIFDENNEKKDSVDRRLCGFFATVCDREAAGCTPDVNEANYDEFSSHFWAALRGKTRMEEQAGHCDYDGDGRISFEEAHAYAILASRNIDIPVKTSGAFLRVHSRLRSEKEEDKELLGLETPYSVILERAGKVDRAVLEGLSRRLNLKGENRGTKARDGVSALAKKIRKVEEEKKAHKKKFDSARGVISRDLRNRWPALENRHSPGAVRLLSKEKRQSQFVSAVEEHPSFEEWSKLRAERSELGDRDLQLSKEYASWRRFLRVFENVAYAANLPVICEEAVTGTYFRIITAEQEGFFDNKE